MGMPSRRTIESWSPEKQARFHKGMRIHMLITGAMMLVCTLGLFYLALSAILTK